MANAAWWMKVVMEEEEVIRKGPWTLEEDNKLIAYVRNYGAARWSSLAKLAGLKRDGKSCRMRWLNYLRPELKHGSFSPEEDRLIIKLHSKWGNRWSCIAKNLPGRTDNEIKNHWRTHIKKMGPTYKSPEGGKNSKSPGGRNLVKECYSESDSAISGSQLSSDTCESDCGYEQLVEGSCDIDTLNNIIADEYTAGMVQSCPTFGWSCGIDSPINVLSNCEEFLWDYDSIDLWNLDDVQTLYR